MKIRTFQLDNYLGCPIYYRNFGDHFEYLTIIKNQLYTAHITIYPRWIKKMRFKLGIDNGMYSKTELDGIIAQLRKLAETTIDFILKKKNK